MWSFVSEADTPHQNLGAGLTLPFHPLVSSVTLGKLLQLCASVYSLLNRGWQYLSPAVQQKHNADDALNTAPGTQRRGPAIVCVHTSL